MFMFAGYDPGSNSYWDEKEESRSSKRLNYRIREDGVQAKINGVWKVLSDPFKEYSKMLSSIRKGN